MDHPPWCDLSLCTLVLHPAGSHKRLIRAVAWPDLRISVWVEQHVGCPPTDRWLRCPRRAKLDPDAAFALVEAWAQCRDFVAGLS